MSLSRKNKEGRIYQKETGIFHGSQIKEIYSEEMKIWKQKPIKKLKSQTALGAPSIIL